MCSQHLLFSLVDIWAYIVVAKARAIPEGATRINPFSDANLAVCGRTVLGNLHERAPGGWVSGVASTHSHTAQQLAAAAVACVWWRLPHETWRPHTPEWWRHSAAARAQRLRRPSTDGAGHHPPSPPTPLHPRTLSTMPFIQ